jgi:RND family efflux transporter MFP subunit
MSSQENSNRDVKSEIIKKRNPWIGTVIAMILIAAVLGYIVKTFFLAGDSDGQGTARQEVTQTPPPSVTLHVVKEADLAASREYIGKVEPIQSVSIKSQVAGVIAGVHFKEGSVVKAGDLLFSIDDRQYSAAVDVRKADLARAEANYDRAAKYYARLASSDRRSVSAADMEMAENDLLQGNAAIEQAKAALKLAQIDLGYTKITAPITGRIGKASFTKGNYVSTEGGSLAEIVQMDPIRVVFALPDRDYLDQMEAFRKSGRRVFNTTISLANGVIYPQDGERDFEENSMNESTGTITMRLRFDNGDGTLIPGELVKVRATPAIQRVSPVIPQEAVLADPQGDFVYVVDDANIAHQRRLTLGPEVGAMCEVVSGLSAGEKIVLKGLQAVRPENPVNPAPPRSENETKTPAELAMESGYDLTPLEGEN